MKNTVLIYSGGLDSTCLLAKLLAEGRNVRALSIDYGQRHKRELSAAATICAFFAVEHKIADMSALRPFLAGSSQTDPTVPVPHGHYAEENMKKTVVPFRNGLMLSVATAWAISLKADTVAYAAHFGDHAIYPDCREEFCKPFGEAMAHADWHIVELERPFLTMTKGDIVAEGARLGIKDAMEESYSCYEGDKVQCGVCGTCSERRMAYIEAGVEDFLLYKKALPLEYIREAQQKNLARARQTVA